jgi:hypothetical protein
MIRFASLDEAWGTIPAAPIIENPYKSAHVASDPVPHDSSLDCHKHLLETYETEGLRGVLKFIPPEIVWRIQALARPDPSHQKRGLTMPFDLTIEEMLLLAIGAFALLMALDTE